MPCLLQPIVLPSEVAAGTDSRLRYFVRCRVETDAIHHLAGRFDVLGRCEPFILAGTFGAVVLLRFQPGFAIGRKPQLLAVLVRLLQALVPTADLLVRDAGLAFSVAHRKHATFCACFPSAWALAWGDRCIPPPHEPALLIQLRVDRVVQQRPVLDLAGIGNQCVEFCLRSTELLRAERHHSAIDACRYIAAHAATSRANFTRCRRGICQASMQASTSSTSRATPMRQPLSNSVAAIDRCGSDSAPSRDFSSIQNARPWYSSTMSKMPGGMPRPTRIPGTSP